MDVILMTILLTLMGVCLVAYFTWLGISSYKLMKFRKKAEGAFKHLERWIDDNQKTIDSRVDSVTNELYNNITTLNNELNNRITAEADLSNNNNNNLYSKVDSNYDKLLDKINGLKKDVDLYYQLLKDTQRNVENLMSPKMAFSTVRPGDPDYETDLINKIKSKKD